MNNNQIVNALFDAVQNNNLDIAGADKKFYTKLVLHAAEIRDLYTQLYLNHPDYGENLTKLIEVLISVHQRRPQDLRERDNKKDENWFLSNSLAGMSLDVSLFCENLSKLPEKLNYLLDLGINLVHFLPDKLTSLEELGKTRKLLHEKGMYLMLNAEKAAELPGEVNGGDPVDFIAMLENVLSYANLGIDILQTGLQSHCILQLLKQCVQVTAPGMAIASDAFTPPYDAVKYFGEGRYLAKECDFVYNTTQMALQWDALATGQVGVMLAAQLVLAEKPYGSTWITYTRSCDEMTFSYEDSMINEAGFNPTEHRKYLMEYYSGEFAGSTASGQLSTALASNPTGICGTLASLCGLEKAIKEKNEHQIAVSIQKILLMQANSFFLGGLPLIYYGDEAAYLNNCSFAKESGQSQDDRWIHRPLIDWKKNGLVKEEGTIENRVYAATKRLLDIRRKLPVVADVKNTRWLPRHNIHIAGFVRNGRDKALYCIFNYSHESAYLTWHIFKHNGIIPQKLYDHWREEHFEASSASDYLILEPYTFYLLEIAE